MTEQIFWIGVVIFGYFMAYAAVGFAATTIWEDWAWEQVGQFWEYTLNEGLKAYYPGVWYFVRYYHVLYSVLYVVLWPVMMPWQMAINTKAIRRVMFRGYHF